MTLIILKSSLQQYKNTYLCNLQEQRNWTIFFKRNDKIFEWNEGKFLITLFNYGYFSY